MKRMILGAVFLLASGMAAEQNMSLLYDPKIAPTPVTLSQTQQQKIIASTIAFLGDALSKKCDTKTSIWKDTKKISAAMTGSFTKANSQQTAYAFYAPCNADNALTSHQIVTIYEKSKVVQVISINGSELGETHEVYALRDINLNNQSEIAVVGSHLTGEEWGDVLENKTLNIIDWQGNQPKVLGNVSQGNAPTGTKHNQPATEYTLYVAKAKKPIFVGLESGSTTALTLLSLQDPTIGVTTIR